jgi:hypothetical protein
MTNYHNLKAVHPDQNEGRGKHAQNIRESITESSNCKADK